MYQGTNLNYGSITKTDYEYFLLDAKTTKLYESDSQIIAEQLIDPFKVKAKSKEVYRLGYVPTFTLLTYPLLFEDKNGTEIEMTPVEDKLEPYRVKTRLNTTNTVLIDFSFTEEIWLYQYY